jgi:glycosyltransferase involved in cell wall biosynthesis
MRIAAFSTLFPPRIVGGAEKTVETLMLGLADCGVDVHVITTGPEEDHSRRQGPLDVHRLRLRNLYWQHEGPRQPVWRRAAWHAIDAHNAAMAEAASPLLDRIRPDAVVTFNLQGFSTAIWGAVKARNRPLLHVIQDYWLLCPRTTMFRNGRNCGSSCAACAAITYPRRHATRHVDAVVGISRAVLALHESRGLFPRAALRKVIHNARPMAGGGHEPTGERSGPLRIGFFGRVSRDKGIELLLGELARLGEDGWTLLVGGRCAELYLADLGRRYPLARARFVGFVEPDDFYRRIDLLVVPSLWREPFGSVVVEAMSHGLPAIVSARGGLPEIVGDDTTGLVFDPDEPGALGRSLRPFIREPDLAAKLRPRMLARARQFTVERQARQYKALLEDLRAASLAAGGWERAAGMVGATTAGGARP